MKDKSNKVLIITGGRTEEAFLADRLKQQEYSMIIAVDHGLEVVHTLGIAPDFIVGDFDSVSETTLKKYRENSTPMETFPREKDKTDTQIAIELALMHNADSIELIGATGSRLDHTLANVHLLLLPLQLKLEACILDGNNKIYLKNSSFTIEQEHQHGDYVPLLPFSEKVEGLTLKGFKYPLDSIILEAGSSLGISNEIAEGTARVEFSNGILLVIESRD
jgi:thiamine pyrophosphokinase